MAEPRKATKPSIAIVLGEIAGEVGGFAHLLEVRGNPNDLKKAAAKIEEWIESLREAGLTIDERLNGGISQAPPASMEESGESERR